VEPLQVVCDSRQPGRMADFSIELVWNPGKMVRGRRIGRPSSDVVLRGRRSASICGAAGGRFGFSCGGAQERENQRIYRTDKGRLRLLCADRRKITGGRALGRGQAPPGEARKTVGRRTGSSDDGLYCRHRAEGQGERGGGEKTQTT